MLLGFKRRFAPMVWEGSKTHTIRLKCSLRRRRGDVCHCYVDPRQKTMARLGIWTCTAVEDITITEHGEIFVAGAELDRAERSLLCWRDGFRPAGSTAQDPRDSFGIFMEYWAAESRKTKARKFPFEGELVHWQFDVRTRAPRPPQI